MNSEKKLKKFDVGIKLLNKFEVLAENEEDAEAIVRSYPDKILIKTSVVSIDYVYPVKNTNRSID